jgi:predicted nucleic acid-binding Zn ribbon protein
MPLFNYKCIECGATKRVLRDNKPEPNGLLCDCGEIMTLQLPNIMNPTVFETVDKRRGIKHRKDQDKRIRQRAKDYFIENELGDLISKIGVEKATKLGYIRKGKKITKEDTK